jgi:hypothetical protein
MVTMQILELMVTMQVLGLTWGEWDEPTFNLHHDIILGADVLYDSASELRRNCIQ